MPLVENVAIIKKVLMSPRGPEVSVAPEAEGGA